jgi:hypothetical protein
MSWIQATVGNNPSSFSSSTPRGRNDRPEDLSSITTKGNARRGIERQINGGGETVGGSSWLCLFAKIPVRRFPHSRASLSFTPPVLESDGREKGDRERVVLELLEQFFDEE